MDLIIDVFDIFAIYNFLYIFEYIFLFGTGFFSKFVSSSTAITNASQGFDSKLTKHSPSLTLTFLAHFAPSHTNTFTYRKYLEIFTYRTRYFVTKQILVKNYLVLNDLENTRTYYSNKTVAF